MNARNSPNFDNSKIEESFLKSIRQTLFGSHFLWHSSTFGMTPSFINPPFITHKSFRQNITWIWLTTLQRLQPTMDFILGMIGYYWYWYGSLKFKTVERASQMRCCDWLSVQTGKMGLPIRKIITKPANWQKRVIEWPSLETRRNCINRKPKGSHH